MSGETLARLVLPLVAVVVKLLHLCEGHAADVISQA